MRKSPAAGPAEPPLNRPHCCVSCDCDGCEVELCIHATRIKEAVHLVQLGARAGLISQLTKIEKPTINRLYRQYCGVPSPPGQAPFTDSWYRESDLRMLQATIIWRLHRRLAQTARSDARIVIDVYEAYTQLVHEPLLDITRAVFVPRLVTMGTWHEKTCEFCATPYLDGTDSNSTSCPGCQLYHLHRCHHCGASMEPQRRGRRRVVCGHCGNTQNGGARH